MSETVPQTGGDENGHENGGQGFGAEALGGIDDRHIPPNQWSHVRQELAIQHWDQSEQGKK